MKRYDLLVSGAGPAGAMAAYWSAKAGLSTLLVEKDQLPRRKCCAGGLIKRAELSLGFPLPNELVLRRIDSAGIVVDGQRIEYPAGRGAAVTVRRQDFDAFLANKAADAGAELRSGVKTGRIREDEGGITATIDGDEAHAGAAIVAEGVASYNATRLFGPRPEGYAAIGAMCFFTTTDPLPNSLDFYLFGTPTRTIKFGPHFPSNGWMFPGQNGGNIGICGTVMNRTLIDSYLNSIERTMGKYGTKIERGPICVRPFPFHARKRIWSRRCVAVGDSAGFASPLSGEGMTYAIHSASMASEVVKRFLNGDLNDLSRYQRLCQDSIIRDMTAAGLITPVMQWLVGVVDTRRFFEVIGGYDDLIEIMAKMVLGDKDWRTLAMRTIPSFPSLFFSSLPVASKHHDQTNGSIGQADKRYDHGQP